MKGIEKLQCELCLLCYLDRFMFGSKICILRKFSSRILTVVEFLIDRRSTTLLQKAA